MIILYYSNDIEVPVGPSSFTDHQIEITRQNGCIQKNAFGQTMETLQLSAVRPVYGGPMGDFFYRDFAFTPGDVQYFLDEKDGILERIEKRKLHRWIPDKIDDTEHRNDINSEKASTINPAQNINRGICVLVLFEDDRMYKYNCRFDVKVGDIVKVDGKMSEKLGEVVEVEGEWDQQEYMKEIVAIVTDKFEGFSITENIIQRKIDMPRIQREESISDSSRSVLFSVELCNVRLENIEVHASASIACSRFEAYALSYIKCEHYLGGEFTTEESYLFDRLNTIKFYKSLDQSSDLIQLSEIIKQKFGGLSGLLILKEYCKEKGIEYSYTDLFRE